MEKTEVAEWMSKFYGQPIEPNEVIHLPKSQKVLEIECMNSDVYRTRKNDTVLMAYVYADGSIYIKAI